MIVRIRLRRRPPGVLRLWSNLLIASGGAALAFVLWSLGSSAFYQYDQARKFDAYVQPAASSAPPVRAGRADSAPPAAETSMPWPALRKDALDPLILGRLEIPRLGLRAMVREGVEEETLRRAVGHLPGTALPGDTGNFVVAAHRDTFFRELRSIRNGDQIHVRTRSVAFTYEVTDLSVVDPVDTRMVQPTDSPVTTLVTCYPFDYLGPAPRRLIVRARMRAALH
jgi:sortase A